MAASYFRRAPRLSQRWAMSGNAAEFVTSLQRRRKSRSHAVRSPPPDQRHVCNFTLLSPPPVIALANPPFQVILRCIVVHWSCPLPGDKSPPATAGPRPDKKATTRSLGSGRIDARTVRT